MTQPKRLNKKIILVGGGTGGHIVPVFEVYRALQSRNDIDQIVVGSGSAIEKNFFGGVPGYRVIKTGKLHRHLTKKNIREMALLLVGFAQAFVLLLTQRPKLIFSKGGYAALPLVFWANVFRIPYFIHESDTEMGLSNRFAAHKAKKIFVTFPPKFYRSLPANERVVFSGPIIRSALSKNINVKHDYFGFDTDRPTIFITGGSQGALAINKCVAKSLPTLLLKFNIIHQTGEYSFRWASDYRSSLPELVRKNYFLTDFLHIEGGHDRMVEAMRVADLIVSRAGANTISEIASLGKAMILIPWKHASADHQTKNAQILAEAGAAAIINDDDLSPKLLITTIEEIFSGDQAKLRLMARNAKMVFAEDGLATIVESIIAELGQKGMK